MNHFEEPDPSTASHHIRALMDTAELAEVTTFLCRVSGVEFAHASALVTSAEELILFRGTNGFIESVHGFRFQDVQDAYASHRLIHSVFSSTDARASRPRSQLVEVVRQSYGREHAQARSRPIIWAFSPECDRALMHCALRTHPMRPLSLKAHLDLPPDIIFYTDQARIAAAVVPLGVAQAVSKVFQEQRESENTIGAGGWMVRADSWEDEVFSRAA